MDVSKSLTQRALSSGLRTWTKVVSRKPTAPMIPPRGRGSPVAAEDALGGGGHGRCRESWSPLRFDTPGATRFLATLFLGSVPKNRWSRDHWCRAARSLHPASEVCDLILWQPKSCSEVVVTGGDESQGLALGVTAPPVTLSSELTDPGEVSLVRTARATGGVEGRGVVDPAILVLGGEDLDEDDVPEIKEVLQDDNEEGGLVLDQATPQGAATSCTAASGASAAVRTSTKMLSRKPALSCGMTTRRAASSLTPRPLSLGVRISAKKAHWKLSLSSG